MSSSPVKSQILQSCSSQSKQNASPLSSASQSKTFHHTNSLDIGIPQDRPWSSAELEGVYLVLDLASDRIIFRYSGKLMYKAMEYDQAMETHAGQLSDLESRFDWESDSEKESGSEGEETLVKK